MCKVMVSVSLQTLDVSFKSKKRLNIDICYINVKLWLRVQASYYSGFYTGDL